MKAAKDTAKTPVRIPRSLYRAMRAECRAQGLTITRGATAAIQLWLERGPLWRKFLREMSEQ